MADIPLKSKAKRPSFFKDEASDQMMSMMLEMMTEVWVLKERVYVLEQVLDEEGLSISDKINKLEFSAEQSAELEAARGKFINTVMRSLEDNFVPRKEMQDEVDMRTEDMKTKLTTNSK